MLKNSKYIYDNCIIADETNSTKKYCKEAQVGVDLTLKSVYVISDSGLVLKDKTVLPKYREITPNLDNYYYLNKGTYIVELNEGVKLNKNNTALIIMRSSLNRCGVSINSAVWDPGYTTQDKGKINTMSVRMTIDSSRFIVEKNARICQIIVFENEDPINTYKGQFQGGLNNLK